MHIEVKQEYCKVSLKNNQGLVKEKLVNLSDLLDELSVYRASNFGLLPRGIRVLETKGSHAVVAVEFPATKRTIKFEAYARDPQEFENVSLPSGIMFEKLLRQPGGSYRHIDSYLYAMGSDRVNFSSDRLYKYPTPNVYEDGRVCWGSVERTDIRHLSAVEGMVASFFSNKFNTDLFYDKVSDGFPENINRGVDEYFKYLSEHEFQTGWLVPAETTVSQVVSRLLKG